jgi:hypothetical protein
VLDSYIPGTIEAAAQSMWCLSLSSLRPVMDRDLANAIVRVTGCDDQYKIILALEARLCVK